MATGEARVLHLADGRRVRIQHQNKAAWSEICDNNPRLAGPRESGDFNILYARSVSENLRPYHTRKTEQRWSYNLDFRPKVGELYFSPVERGFGATQNVQVVVEPNIKPSASPNKAWPWSYWEEFARLAIRAGYRLTQLGPQSIRRLPGATTLFTPGFRLACAVLAGAKAVVTSEGGMHHAAAALNVPGVVIFGGFTPVELTGYPLHRNLGVSLGDACGMRTPCPHCDREMKAITPEQVLNELTGVLNEPEKQPRVEPAST